MNKRRRWKAKRRRRNHRLDTIIVRSIVWYFRQPSIDYLVVA